MINIKNIRSRKAMTMIELLVAVSVLAILILIFGRVLSKSQAVVTTSQANFEAISAARAIGDAFKRDIQQASQAGFLCITQNGTTGNPYLVTCSVGASPSKLVAQTGSARITVYGINGTTGTSDQILCRIPWVIANAKITANDDIWAVSQGFTYIQTISRENLKTLLDSLIANVQTTTFTSSLFSTYAEVEKAWKVLSTDVTYLSITWTPDGQNWYGIFRNSGTGTANKPQTTTLAAFDVNTNTQTEFSATAGSSATPAYWALWTKDNPAAWPKAIKISFVCKNPQARTTTANAANTGEKFDIVIPVRP